MFPRSPLVVSEAVHEHRKWKEQQLRPTQWAGPEHYLTTWQWWRGPRLSSWIHSWRWPSWPAGGPGGTLPSWSPAPSGRRRHWALPGSSATPGLASGSLGLEETGRERWAINSVPSPWANHKHTRDREQMAQQSFFPPQSNLGRTPVSGLINTLELHVYIAS